MECRLHEGKGATGGNPGTGVQTPSALNTIELNIIQDWSQCTKNASTSKGPPDCRTGADGGGVYFFTYLWGHGQRVINNFFHLGIM